MICTKRFDMQGLAFDLEWTMDPMTERLPEQPADYNQPSPSQDPQFMQHYSSSNLASPEQRAARRVPETLTKATQGSQTAMRSTTFICWSFAFLLQAQDQRFEVVSIRPSDPGTRGMNLSLTPGGGLSARGVTLQSLVLFAYDVRDSQVSGLPNWARTNRFDVTATSEESGSGPENVRKRTRTMLADRFQMVIRLEDQERPVYFLTQLNTGHKMKKMMSVVLAGTLGRPAIDRTGLEGRFEFKVEWAEGRSFKESGREQPENTGPSIFTAIREQVGLRHDAGKAPVRVVVVEKVEKRAAN